MQTQGTETTLISQPLKLWEKVLIIVGTGQEAGTYVGRIEDIIDGGLVITAPEFVSGKTLLRDDLSVIVQITRDDAVYQFNTHIRRHGPSTAGHVFLTAPRNFRRVQRRLFVRIQFREPIEYAQLSAPVDWGTFPKCLTWHSTVMHDISGGGLRVTAATTANAGDIVLLRLPKMKASGFPEYIFAVCRRVWEADGASQLGLEFILEEGLAGAFGADEASHIPTQARQFTRPIQNKLVVWIFQRQIELRQKGLL
jgi:c-di-GMP-binding flagellar brake protein YcgR